MSNGRCLKPNESCSLIFEFGDFLKFFKIGQNALSVKYVEKLAKIPIKYSGKFR